MKKFFRNSRRAAVKKLKNVKKLGPVILIPIVVVVLLLVAGGGYLLFFGGDDSDGLGGAPRPVLTPGDLPKGGKGNRVKQAPRKRTGVVDEARRVGRLVSAQARGTIVSPRRVTLRISAAPKQTVTVDWQLGCFLNRRAKVGRGKYRAKTPDTRRIPVSISGAETCIATATAGLTRVDGKGRVKVAVIAG